MFLELMSKTIHNQPQSSRHLAKVFLFISFQIEVFLFTVLPSKDLATVISFEVL